MSNFNAGDEAIATTTNIMTGIMTGHPYKVLSVRGHYIEICTDYGS